MAYVSTSLMSAAALSPVILGLCEAVKRVGLPKRFIPLLAVLLGVLFAWSFAGFQFIPEAVLEGVVAGLAACGCYDLGKDICQGAASRFKRLKKKS